MFHGIQALRLFWKLETFWTKKLTNNVHSANYFLICSVELEHTLVTANISPFWNDNMYNFDIT